MAYTYPQTVTKPTMPPQIRIRWENKSKRLLDLTVASLALGLLSPILIIAALAIKMTSKGPVLFKQTRTGLNGAAFTIYKFRSMKLHSDAATAQATKGDARVTAVGAILRKTSIDELPQLLNVLAGDMAIVGPRPHALAHDAYYGARIPTYHQRFAVKPGITGLAQINDCRGETAQLHQMETRIRLDLQYIREWSVWGDLAIILRTPLALVRSRNAY